MSQAASQISSLSACAKCNSRHPFEELSQGHQLCKDCRGSFQVIKCNYCRTEFHNEIKASSQQTNGTKNSSSSSSSSSICKKCKQLEEQHGKPGPCAYCNIIAAFIGTKCQRCTNSEKKYGPPLSCEHCKQKCAFDRTEPESKKKVDGKLLCWLCTMAYKRTLAKARQKEAAKLSSSHHKTSSGAGGSASKSMYSSSTSSSSNRHHPSASSRDQRHSSGNNTSAGPSDISYSRSSSTAAANSHRHSSSHESTSQHNGRDKHRDANKKPRLDSNSSAGLQSSASASSLMDSRFVDPNSTNDLSTVVTQLKDQVSILNKKLLQKERELLNKDQQIAELKATTTRDQKESREKMNTMQKQHMERVSELQAKIVAMQKQLVAQSRAAKTTTTNYVEPSLVI